MLLLSFPSSVFEKAVPFFIAFSGIMIIVSGKHHSLNTKKQPMWLKVIYFIALLMKNARKSPYFNAGMDRAKLT